MIQSNTGTDIVENPNLAVDWPLMAEQRPDAAQCIVIAPTAVGQSAR